MEPSKMEEFVANATLLAAHLTEQCNKAAAAQQSSAHELQASAIVVRQTIEDGKREMSAQARGAVHDALAQEISAATHSIGETAARLRQVADHLQREQAHLSQRARFLGWKSLGVLSVACLLLVAGSGYAAWHNVQRSERAKVDAEVLEALQHITITSCSGQPCIKLQDGLPRWQKNDQYVLIDTSGKQEGAAGGGR
ncbi:hypothetical protein J2X02_000841 [Pseudoxanthomonas japonensis]|uniref:hypothetical protein n=1 Tax=Pseudoxanthomonas TaxID=83618 RepID=UPI000786462C|nr:MULTISPECIES: hypothetical protein [Pseudoxanthomonas]MDR7068024.1 hypothetical protein [Pseudoxanthomonas japonensis]